MNYFVIEGYKDAAEAFSQECGLSPSIDVDSIQDRMNIRNAIQNGNVEEAIERVNDLNPEILDTNPKLYFHLQQQRLIEYIREGKITEALEFAQDELAPRGEENPEFLEELERTMALLAFDDTSVSPVGDLLHPSQRQRTASELNAAILTSQSQEKDPKLPSLLKMLVWAQDELDEKVLFPRMKNLVTAELSDTNDSTTNNTAINNSFMST
ncbi:CTLH/CRA C-terminal to lish motif domain-containing protein [Gigaspora rosea]|nr:CTLH/CRA C-terminal to lish motif domain-containing protein [Gigaspora rosea]